MKHSSDQLYLPGFEPSQPSRGRPTDALSTEGRRDLVFFAIRPDDEVQAQIADLTTDFRRQRKLVGRPMRRDRLHLTLPWELLPRAETTQFVHAAKTVGSEIVLDAFDLSLDRVLSFEVKRTTRPLVLACQSEPLQWLYAELGDGLKERDFGEHLKRKFTPHVTLLYDPANVAAQPVEPIHWRVREFLLLHSLRGEGRHVVLARWPLRG